MILTRVSPNLLVNNLDETILFYQEVLGFELGLALPDQPPYTWASMTSGDVELMFQSREHPARNALAAHDGQPGGAFSLYIAMLDLRTLYQRISDRARILTELYETSYGTREFEMEDPNGIILTFAEAL